MDAYGSNAVVAAYNAARARGSSRCEAFVRAVRVYCTLHPDLPANRAGTEVARLLLAAGSGGAGLERRRLPRTDEMEYVKQT